MVALQISLAFGPDIDIDKEAVRRVLAKHYRPDGSGSTGPSWLTLIAQSKDRRAGLTLFAAFSLIVNDPGFR